MMQLRVYWLLAGLRVRQALRAGAEYRAAGAVTILAVAIIIVCGFAYAIITVRHGPCYQQLSRLGGRPHYVLTCGRRQP
jgi:hypothetical protein